MTGMKLFLASQIDGSVEKLVPLLPRPPQDLRDDQAIVVEDDQWRIV